MELKRRIVDCLNARHGWKIEETDVRLWKFSDVKEKLVDACQQISQRDSMEDVENSNDPDLELNSGVEFPGESLEPYTTAQNLEDDTLEDSYVIVEVRESEHLSFAF